MNWKNKKKKKRFVNAAIVANVRIVSVRKENVIVAIAKSVTAKSVIAKTANARIVTVQSAIAKKRNRLI